MFKLILAAVKFSPASLYALEKSAQLAKTYGAKLHLFHALDYRLQEYTPTDPRMTEVMRDTEKRFKTEVFPRLEGLSGVHYEYRPADPALEVCKLARAQKVDLIVLGCHQIVEKIGLGRIDYVGMTILEKAPCPIMLVPFNG